MRILRQYQLDVIFAFFATVTIIWSSFYMLEYIGIDPHNYEWYIAGPFIALYFALVWTVRSKINLADRRNLTTKSMVYWLALGITLFASYSSPISARDYWSINLIFLVFTLLLADSYWDFKKITMKSLKEDRKK